MAGPSPDGDVRIVSPINSFVLNTYTDKSVFSFFFAKNLTVTLFNVLANVMFMQRNSELSPS